MSFLVPAAAFLGLTIPAILALYFLRIRRPTRVVPALHLWPDQIRDRQANVPWQRLRPSWLLLLQLLAAATLVAAAIQPALPASATLARHSLVLLDASASMQATDVAPSRLEEAKRQVAAIIDQLGPDDRMTLIAVSPTSRIAASAVGDRDTLHRALKAITASNGSADLSGALALAAGLVRPGDDARAYLFSDGIVDPLRASFGDGLPFPVEYHRIGVSGENVGLTALTVRTSAQSRAATLHVQNFGQQAHTISIEWRADGRLLDVRPITLAAGQAQDLALLVPADATGVSAHIQGADIFALDDSATAVARTPRAFRVLLVTPGNVFLEQALRLRADLQVDVVSAAVDGDRVWSEWEMRGSRPDGVAHLMRGVIVFEIVDGRAGSPDTSVVCAGEDPLETVAFAPDGNTVAVVAGGNTELLDLDGGHALAALLRGRVLAWRA